MTISDGIHLLHQDSHSCVIDGYDKLVFILRIRIVLTLCDMNSEGCLYPSSWDNLSTDLGCILCISSLANFLHVHSIKHFWCVTAPKHIPTSQQVHTNPETPGTFYPHTSQPVWLPHPLPHRPCFYGRILQQTRPHRRPLLPMWCTHTIMQPHPHHLPHIRRPAPDPQESIGGPRHVRHSQHQGRHRSSHKLPMGNQCIQQVKPPHTTQSTPSTTMRPHWYPLLWDTLSTKWFPWTTITSKATVPPPPPKYLQHNANTILTLVPLPLGYVHTH